MSWFSPPSELLPAPAWLLGSPRRARRPPALTEAVRAPAKRARADAPSAAPSAALPPDRAAAVLGATVLGPGRCELGGRVCVVPQRPQDFDGCEDENEEVLVVEVAAPGGRGWLEDPEAQLVLTRFAPPRAAPLEAVRRLVLARVDLFARGSPQLRRLYQLCRPQRWPDYALALVAVSDLPEA